MTNRIKCRAFKLSPLYSSLCESCSQSLHHPSILPIRHQFHRRAAIPPCDPEGRRQQQSGDHKVLPGVERPLAVPGELHGAGEWLEVGDGPLVAVGAAGTQEIAQQVQVEADEDQERRQPWMGRQAAALDNRAEGEAHHRASNDVGGEGADDRKCQSMQ